MAIQPDLSEGMRLGNYVLIRKIGEGGMGAVYEAKQEGLDRRVALKVLAEKLVSDRAYLERFRREARAAAALDHPSIVQVYDIGEEQGRAFFSMQFVEGMNLADRLRREGRIPVSEALTIVEKVADALDYAWTHGRLIHRDVKPENIMLTPAGQVKLADLGLAKSVTEDPGTTVPGTTIGTPSYMAPEQGRGARDADCRSDIYALGITLFQAITGQLPFQGDTPLSVMMAHAEQPLPDPLSLDPDIPVNVCSLIRRMCAKDPAERFQTPGQLVSELAVLGHVGVAGGRAGLQDQPTLLATQALKSPVGSKPKAWLVLAVTGWLVALACLTFLGVRGLSAPLDEEQLERLYKSAVYFAQKEPEEFDAIIQNFRDVEEKSEGTKYVMMARSERRKFERARDVQLSCRRLQSRVEDLVAADRFSQALALLEKLPEDRRLKLPDNKWRDLLSYVERRGEQRVKRLLSQARALAQAGDLDEARARYELVRSFGVSVLEEAVIVGLTELRERECAAQKEKQSEAEAVYRQAFEEVEKLARAREYDKALETCEGFGADPRFELLRDRVLWDAADLKRARRVFDAAVAALRRRIGQPFSLAGTEAAGTLKEIKDGRLVWEADGKAASRALSALPAVRVAELAGPAMAEAGGEGQRCLAVFWLYEGEPARASRALEQARAQGVDVSRYESGLDPVLVVDTTPPGATVALDLTLEAPLRLPVQRDTTYQLRVSKPGYFPETVAVEVGRGGEYRVPVVLQKTKLSGALTEAFEVPIEAEDQYGNPIRKGADQEAGLPLEIRHRRTGLHLVLIPAGKFLLGSPDDERGREGPQEGPLHPVELSSPFYLGKYEVTQAEWKAIMASNPSKYHADRNPVEMVSWNDCQEFIKKLNSMLGAGPGPRGFALPTEAQWEYACRAGAQSRFSFGDDATSRELTEYAWYRNNSGGHPNWVGQKKPNAWGLYDMHGNVLEWVADWYGTYPNTPQVDPSGPPTGLRRSIRNGGCKHSHQDLRCAKRHGGPPHEGYFDLGFRVAVLLR